MDFSRIDTEINQIKKTLAPLSNKERVEYLWDYYKVVAICFVGFVVAIITVIHLSNAPDLVFDGVFANVALQEGEDAYITSEWLEVMGGNPKKEKVNYSTITFGNFSQGYNNQELVQAQKTAAMIMAEMLDYVLMDDIALQYYTSDPNTQLFTSLEDLLPQEQLQQWEEKLFYFEEQGGAKYPIAVDITETDFGKSCITTDHVYIAFPGNTGRAEWCDEFFEYLLNWKPKA